MNDTTKQTTEITELLKRITELEIQNREYLEGWQRMKADTQNRERSMQQERSRITDMVAEETTTELIPVLDAFAAAFNAPAWQSVDVNWRKGVEYIHQQLIAILQGKGVESFGTVGSEYDPVLHDIHGDMPTGDATLTVSKIIRPGYKIKDRIIRPASVTLQ